MRPQAVRSIRYVLLLLCGMCIVWYLQYIDSWLVAPAFIVVVVLAFAFSSIPANVKSIRSKLDSDRDSGED